MRGVSNLLVLSCAMLWAASATAQVDWGEMFPEEGVPAPAKPAAPPAAAPKARRAEPAEPAEPATGEVVRKPAPAPKVRKQETTEEVVKPAPRVLPPAPVEESEPAAPPAARNPVAPPAAAPPARAAAKRAEPPAADAVPVEASAPAVPHPPSGGEIRLADLGLQEGDIITAANLHRAAEYLSPGMIWGVNYGWKLELVEPKRIVAPRPYREATEKYAKQVKLVRDGMMLQNYVAGQPFPIIDPNDPDAAKKIMWNFYYRAEITDDVDVRLFDGDTGSIGHNQGMQVERHYLVAHLRRLNYNGRLFVDPKPNLPNQEGFRYKESIGPLLEPFDLKGVGGLAYRYLDPSRQDDTWLYLPQLRRVRRLSSAQRSDALFGQDSDVDSYYGYNGHVAWNTYRLIGERIILATMHARNVPVKWQQPEDFFFVDVWEPRRVWVVEAVSTLPQYAYSKRVLFIDQESYVIPYSDIYDRAGQLWKIWVHQFGFRKKTIPDLPSSTEYPDEMAFVNAVTILDTQLAHATKAGQPTPKTKGEDGRYLNMGERGGITEDIFTVAHMIAVGH